MATKQELIKKVSEKTGKTNKDTTEIVNALFESIQESLGSGEEVRLINFGVFSVKQTAERQGVNPRTREKITVPASMRVRFTPGKDLNESVANVKAK